VLVVVLTFRAYGIDCKVSERLAVSAWNQPGTSET
jgi:hypothetical protein